jgi:sigma-B regulation protein RsbU (phosphoserine phosphatase)
VKLDSHLERSDSLETRLVDLEIQLEAKNNELFEIARVGAMITSILDLDGILSVMIEMSLRLLHAEVGCILTLEENKDEPTTKISYGVDYNLIKMMKLEDEMDIAQRAGESGETVIVNDFPPETNIPAEVNSVIAAPLTARGETIGVLVAVNKTEEGGFNTDDKNILETLVSFATVAIENSKLMEERLIRQKLENELALAKTVQKALLPSEEISISGASISHIYFPAGQVGGDYYDIIPITDNKFVVIVGDVSNKGVPAALVMTAVRSVVRHEVRSNNDIARIMNNINQTLCRDIMRTDNMFISLIIALIDLDNMQMTYCNAGHLPPLFFNPDSGEINQLKAGGLILGQFEEVEYVSDSVTLNSGDRILCFTDGITESMDLNQNMYGREGLISFTNDHKNLEDTIFLKQLKDTVDRFAVGTGSGQFDDITCVLVRIK